MMEGLFYPSKLITCFAHGNPGFQPVTPDIRAAMVSNRKTSMPRSLILTILFAIAQYEIIAT